MPRYFIELSYRGENYHGWQVQPGAVTVQGVIEAALSTLARQSVTVTGAGRTDAGVNARMMVAHCDLPEAIAENPGLLRSLNAMVGRDIAIHNIKNVAEDAHARFDATERTYRYFLHTEKNPFLGKLSWGAPSTLDFEAMNAAAKLIIGQKDFTSFSKLHTDVKTNICNVKSARWTKMESQPGRWYFEISADRFLRNMVRAVVGTLIDVGRHKTTPADIVEIIAQKDRCKAGMSMPAEPLFLWEILYDNDKIRR